MEEKIIIGTNIANPLYTFTNATVKTISCVLSSALVGDELAIDQLMPVVYSAAYIRVKFIPKNSTGLVTADGYDFLCYPGTGYLDKLPYGTPIWYYSDDVLIGKFYSQRVVRTGKTWFDITAVSYIGILDGQRHYGGIYTGQTFQTVAAEIIGNSGMFSCSSDVASIKIYGWLPIDSRRANLHQLLFACGVSLSKDDSGNMVFQFPDTDTVKNIPDKRIFLGGNIDYMAPATRAEVTEHTFEALDTDELVTLYDNAQSGDLANNTFVSFQDAPIHDLTTTGTLTVSESGVNYAVVSGTGTLTGKKYTHITRVLSRVASTTGENKTVSVTDATLVNVANSENVVQRVLSYYSSAKTIQSDVILNGERPGDQISFNNPFNEPEQAFIASAEISSSSFLRAACELVTGYVPSGGGNNYSQTIILTGAGTWASPITGKIRVAIIQGGHGGSGGHRGTDGNHEYYSYDSDEDSKDITVKNSEEPGTGGLPGSAGIAGKVLVVTLQVTAGQKFSYQSGVGGIGGNGETETSEATEGTEGGHTTFGTYTSANGTVIDGGYYDIINNVLYAGSGESGTSGGSGQIGGKTDTEKGGGPLGGNAAAGTWVDTYRSRLYSIPWKSGGGGQGGNAYGQAGEAGETMTDTFAEDYSAGSTSAHIYKGAKGGDGATPIKPPTPAAIGTGGAAGHGGGGGATGATFSMTASSLEIHVRLLSYGGKAGNGGEAGDGAPGGIIIYL